MISALGSMDIQQVLLFNLVLFLAMTSNVESSNQQCTLSCGNIRNISYPFRLKSDPKRCGISTYELAYEDNRTVKYFNHYRYYVLFINYSTYEYKVVKDWMMDSCLSLPRHSLTPCSNPVSSPFYNAIGPCITGSYSSNTSSNRSFYALINPKASDVRDFCTIWRRRQIHYSEFGEDINSSSYYDKLIHNTMADGFFIGYDL